MKFKICSAAALMIFLAYDPIVNAEDLTKEERADIEQSIGRITALA